MRICANILKRIWSKNKWFLRIYWNMRIWSEEDPYSLRFAAKRIKKVANTAHPNWNHSASGITYPSLSWYHHFKIFTWNFKQILFNIKRCLGFAFIPANFDLFNPLTLSKATIFINSSLIRPLSCDLRCKRKLDSDKLDVCILPILVKLVLLSWSWDIFISNVWKHEW